MSKPVPPSTVPVAEAPPRATKVSLPAPRDTAPSMAPRESTVSAPVPRSMLPTMEPSFSSVAEPAKRISPSIKPRFTTLRLSPEPEMARGPRMTPLCSLTTDRLPSSMAIADGRNAVSSIISMVPLLVRFMLTTPSNLPTPTKPARMVPLLVTSTESFQKSGVVATRDGTKAKTP